MDVELLVVPDCPNESATRIMLRAILDEVGLASVTIRTTVIGSQDDAEQRGFIGSPTVLIEGSDPFALSERAPALACRMYFNPQGPTGVPDPAELRRILKCTAVGLGQEPVDEPQCRPDQRKSVPSPGNDPEASTRG